MFSEMEPIVMRNWKVVRNAIAVAMACVVFLVIVAAIWRVRETSHSAETPPALNARPHVASEKQAADPSGPLAPAARPSRSAETAEAVRQLPGTEGEMVSVTDRTLRYVTDAAVTSSSPEARTYVEKALGNYAGLSKISFVCDTWKGERTGDAPPDVSLSVDIQGDDSVMNVIGAESPITVKYMQGVRYIFQGGKLAQVDHVEEGAALKIPSLLSRFAYVQCQPSSIMQQVGEATVQTPCVTLLGTRADSPNATINLQTGDVMAMRYQQNGTGGGMTQDHFDVYTEYLDYAETRIGERTFRFPRRIKYYLNGELAQDVAIKEVTASLE